MNAAPEIVALAHEDRDDLAQFLAAWPGEQRPASAWQERFRLWWDLNPYYRLDPTPGWLIKDQTRIVGFLGLVPLSFQLGGQERLVFGSTTWRVLPSHRNMSFVAMLKLLRHVKRSLLFVPTSNPELIKVLQGLKLKPLPRPSNLDASKRRSIFILRLDRALLAHRKDTLHWPIGRKLAGLAFLPYAALRWAQMRAAHGLEVRVIEEAGDNIDDLWRRTKQVYANTNPRTREFIGWHCFASPAHRKLVLGCFRGPQLSGLLIIDTANRRGLRVYECLDVWSDPAEPGAVRALLAGAIEHAARAGIDAIDLPHFSPELETIAHKYGFMARGSHELEYFFGGAKELMDQVSANNSFFCTLQGDIGL